MEGAACYFDNSGHPLSELPLEGRGLTALLDGRLVMDGRAQGIKVGKPIFDLDDDFAVHQRRLSGELGAGLDHPAIRAGQCRP